ncbi:MAG: nickel pincer cofactor biosynthesis protein LarB [Synergistaceae bacterium]|nr:nickel pincer cofactor biosynthesis protein LarB [Synergistaceae bacterium]
MDENTLIKLAEQLKAGELTPLDFVSKLKKYPFENVAGGEVKLDNHRPLRKGFAEIVYCPGKSASQIEAIAEALKDTEHNTLFSRVSREQNAVISRIISDAVYHEKANMTGVPREKFEKKRSGLTVVTAGSSDVPVAEEAAVTAEYMGCNAERLYDVGIAGIHRLLSHLDVLQTSKVIIAVAGMEGALPSVVGGLVNCPVIAVPTSVGYGASFGGVAALLTMLNSCSTGVAVVNIDNGLGAGFFAARILIGKV